MANKGEFFQLSNELGNGMMESKSPPPSGNTLAFETITSRAVCEENLVFPKWSEILIGSFVTTSRRTITGVVMSQFLELLSVLWATFMYCAVWRYQQREKLTPE
jgi:hypothetical protein